MDAEIKNDLETLGLKELIVRYMRRWKLFLAVFLFTFIPAGLYLGLYPRTYEFMARIQIQEDQDVSISGMGLGEAAGLMKSFGIGGKGVGVSIEDEIAILTSGHLFGRMISSLGLNVEYTRPRSFYKMYEEAPLKLSPDSVADPDDEYRLKVSVADGKVNVKARSFQGKEQAKYTFTSLPARIKIGETTFTLAFDHGGAIDRDFSMNIKYKPVSWQAEDLAGDFNIEDLSKTSNVIELSCTDHVKARGKAMLSALICEYNMQAKSYREREDEKMMTFVESRIDTVLSELSSVESRIEQYKTRHGMTLLESDVLFYTEQMKELQSKMVEMETQAHMVRMMSEYVNNPANRYEVIPPLLSMADGEKGSAITIYNEAILERERLLANSNENNPAFKTANMQVDKLRESVHVMIDNADKGCQRTLADLQAKEKKLLEKMKSVPMLEHEYIGFKRQQEILQGVYLLLLQKREETVLSLGQQTERARVIDPAFVMKKPVGPRKLYAAIGMLLLTLVIPVGFLTCQSLVKSLWAEYRRTR
ncbi:MAG: tyrosine protein kinase [Tannerella sp.]|jgi:uncharacterized protein involved in exopolysaccharide biosynthesis|nr:tyrosine protein kinase [Tannerella sp.]